MHDRSRAIAYLQQARDILIERLTERILESREALLEDALGLSYSSEIDAVQEQIGQRLNHVNLLLNNLPPADEPPLEDAAPTSSPPVLAYEPAVETRIVPRPSEVAADEPPAVIYVGTLGEGGGGPSFAAFMKHILANDSAGAERMLTELFDVSPERGRRCAQRFQEQLRERPQLLQKAMGLRHELTTGSVNGALILLWECFGLQGLESIAVLQTLRARLAASTTTGE